MINKNYDWVALLTILHGITSVRSVQGGYVFDSGNKSYKIYMDGRSAVFYELNKKQEVATIVGSALMPHEISKIDKIIANQIAMQEYLAPIQTICKQAIAIINHSNTYNFNLINGEFGKIVVGKSNIKYEVRDENGNIIVSSNVYDMSPERIATVVQMLDRYISYCNMASRTINTSKQR